MQPRRENQALQRDEGPKRLDEKIFDKSKIDDLKNFRTKDGLDYDQEVARRRKKLIAEKQRNAAQGGDEGL